jgi:hypothetical protein
LLADALAVFGVVPERGTALGSFEQDYDGVDANLISFDREPCCVPHQQPTLWAPESFPIVNPRSLELLQQTGVTDAILHEARSIHRVAPFDA